MDQVAVRGQTRANANSGLSGQRRVGWMAGRFEIIANGVLIGTAEFECADPPTNVLWGWIENQAARRLVDAEGARVEIRPVGGAMLQTSADIVLEELDEEGSLEIRIFGLEIELWREHFAEHIEGLE